MRIPFDLIAALLGVEAVRELLARRYPAATLAQALALDEARTSTGEALLALLAFWLVVWLAHELLARNTEWRTRWGRWPRGVEEAPEFAADSPPERPAPRRARWHPLQSHGYGMIAAQALAVGAYVLFLWHYGWPLKTTAWPSWLGLDAVLSRAWCDALRDSMFVGGILDLGPFALAMLIGWIPKQRIVAWPGSRWGWMSFEARLAFLPYFLWLGFYLALDLAGQFVPPEAVASWEERPWLAILLGLAALVLVAAVFMPWVVLHLWQCRPLPDGPLRERLIALLERSGVRARAILTWGSRKSGLANACVLGPWSRMRYILISPRLTEMLSLEECEAVIAHEIGHVRHGHLVLLVSLIVCLAALGELVLRLLRHMAIHDPLIEGGVFLLLILVYLRLFFGAVSRRCEREADLSAAELVGSPFPLISALEKISAVAGGIRDLYSWHHDSIARRIERLLNDGLDPRAIERHHVEVRRMRRGLLLMAGLTVAALLAVSVLDHPRRAAAPQPAPAAEERTVPAARLRARDP